MPRYIALGTDARVAAVTSMAGTLMSTAANVHAMCKLNPACDYANPQQFILISSRPAEVVYGWLTAGNSQCCGAGIDTWINYGGFTASVPNANATVFALDGSAVPANCAVSYWNASSGGGGVAFVTVVTSGC